MSDRGRLYRRRGTSIYFKERLYVMSLGILMASLAHGATEDGLGEDCRGYSGEEGARSQQMLHCAPVDSARGEDDHLPPAYQDLRPAESDNGSVSEQSGHVTTPNPSRASGVRKSNRNTDISPSTAVNDSAMGVVDGKASTSGGTSANTADVEEDDLDDTEAEEEVDDEGDEQGVNQLAVDGAALDVNSSTSGPQDTELFNVDIEAASSEDEVPSAIERDLFGLGTSYRQTSDDYDAHSYSFSYRNHRREWFWPWQQSTARGLDWGIDVDRTKGESGTTEFTARHLQGMLGGYLSAGTYLQAQLGRHALDTDLGDRDITSRHVTAMFGLQQNFSLQLDTGRDFAYTAGSVTGGITKQLTVLEHAASFRWRPHLRLRLQGQSGFRKHDESDNENEARFSDLSALYGISPEWPWVWAGVGAQQLNYRRQVVDYWSPDLYKAYGLRFESSFPLSTRLSGSAAANLNRQDEDGSRGNGYDIRVGAQYRLFGQLYGRLEAHTSKSIQQGSTWKSDVVSFSLSGPLF